MNDKHLYIQTIGCQMNVYDSDRIAAMLRHLGYRPTSQIKKADLVVVNTCTIREKAEQKAFSFLGRLADLKRRNPDLIVAVGGCMAQQEGKNILKRVPWIDVVFGTQALERLHHIIAQVESRRCRVVDVSMAESVGTYEPDGEIGGSPAVSRFVTIMQGCDNYCTYCVVPHVRGRERSRAPERILAEIEGLVRSGTREVTLLGQNVNSYGQKEGLCSFATLLSRVSRIDGLTRIRFTTSHPKDLSPDLIQAFGALPKLCHHIHLPVQSGSDAVLKRMNRKYTISEYRDRVSALRDACPDIAITSDIIVGFPGETESDFEKTLDLMKTIAFDGLFAFMYSDRPAAPALHFGDKLPEGMKNQRLRKLLALQDEQTLENNQRLVGTLQEILVDGGGPAASGPVSPMLWSGRTTTNRIVHFPHDPDLAHQNLLGTTLRVRIDEAFCHSLRGAKAGEIAHRKKGEASYAA